MNRSRDAMQRSQDKRGVEPDAGEAVEVEERVVLDEVGADRKADKEGRDDVKNTGRNTTAVELQILTGVIQEATRVRYRQTGAVRGRLNEGVFELTNKKPCVGVGQTGSVGPCERPLTRMKVLNYLCVWSKAIYRKCT